MGYEFVWEVELRVRDDSAPPARLDDTEKLGWSTWLGGSKVAGETPTARPAPIVASAGAALVSGYAVGMVFEPEQYVGKHSRT